MVDTALDGTWPMRTSSAGPCRTWPLDPSCSCLPTPHEDGWDETMRYPVETATDILWHLTAGRWGLCRDTIRPCRHPVVDAWPTLGAPPRSSVTDGTWFNLFCGHNAGGCGCAPTSEITLPGPVHVDTAASVDWWPAPTSSTGEGNVDASEGYGLDVWLDGQLLAPERWALYDNRLVRTDGETWPDCQHVDRPPRIRHDEQGQRIDPDWWTADGTFAVVYWRGLPVPPGGRRAAAVLACELWKACRGDKTCRLPSRVQNVTREGISYTILDPQDYLTEGRTGLADVDMWLAAVNPHSVREPSTVWSPDLHTARRQHTTGRR